MFESLIIKVVCIIATYAVIEWKLRKPAQALSDHEFFIQHCVPERKEDAATEYVDC